MPGSTGGAVANGTTYRQIVNVAGCNNIRARLLTVGATGTLNIKPIRPVAHAPNDESVIGLDGEIDPTKVTAYGTGTATVARRRRDRAQARSRAPRRELRDDRVRLHRERIDHLVRHLHPAADQLIDSTAGQRSTSDSVN
jgi:hypothetical protein